MDRSYNVLSEQTARTLLEKIAPGSTITSISVPDGSFSNYTHILSAQKKDGNSIQLVVRRYKVFGNYNRGEKAQREFKAFELMNRSGIPSPEAILLDETGEILGIPGIVTRLVPGALILENPPDPLTWARELAVMLARIHSIPLDDESRRTLLDANAEASWFLNKGSIPDYMKAFPGGASLWQATRDRYQYLQPVPPCLVHIDYWSGNILWHEGEISAVLDWEEAASGDPVIDVAYARMNMYLMGLPEAAVEFLHVYEIQTGGPVKNLGIWEMAAAVRPMIDPADWQVDRAPGFERFQQFIEAAQQRA